MPSASTARPRWARWWTPADRWIWPQASWSSRTPSTSPPSCRGRPSCECVSRHWVRYLLRRQELKEEKASIDALLKAFDESGGDLREVLVAVTGTKAFTHRQPFAGEQTR